MAASADGVSCGVGAGAGVAGATGGVGESAVGVEASSVDAVTALSAFLVSVDVSDGGCASDAGGVTGTASASVVGVVSPFCGTASLGALLSLTSDAASGVSAARLTEGGVAGFSSFARSGRIRN